METTKVEVVWQFGTDSQQIEYYIVNIERRIANDLTK